MTFYQLKLALHKPLFHIHEWSKWEYTNQHSWSHAVTMFRNCHTCYEDEYKLIELNCPQFKIKGEYCHWCDRYEKEWSRRLRKMFIEKVLDTQLERDYNEEKYTMTTEQKVNKRVPKPLTERNVFIYESISDGKSTVSELAKKYGISRARIYELFHKVEKSRQI